jgi:threonine dehydrogenase-like Zn-dependent dehydrogenase
MKNWQITAKEKIEFVSAAAAGPLPQNCARVRITRAGICDSDILLYNTDIEKYPIIPCRHAVGVITEATEESGLKKGDVAAIDPYIPCGDCYFCKSGNFSNCQNMQIYGQNKDGFLRDFAIIPLKNIKRLPENVKAEDAIFLEYIASAKKLLDSMDIQKGEHVVIAGADILGNIIAQLVIYYQAIPIMVDDSEKNLEIAKNSDIYYTVADEKDINKRIFDITGGRLARYVIYISGTKKNLRNTLSFACNGGCIGITGLTESTMTANLNVALQKQLTIKCVKNGYGNIDTAINMLATKIVDLSRMVTKVFKFSDAGKAFEMYKNEDLNSIFQIVIDCLEE